MKYVDDANDNDIVSTGRAESHVREAALQWLKQLEVAYDAIEGCTLSLAHCHSVSTRAGEADLAPHADGMDQKHDTRGEQEREHDMIPTRARHVLHLPERPVHEPAGLVQVS